MDFPSDFSDCGIVRTLACDINLMPFPLRFLTEKNNAAKSTYAITFSPVALKCCRFYFVRCVNLISI